MLCHFLIPLTSIKFLPVLFRATASSPLDGTKKEIRCFRPTDLALEENVEAAGEVKDCDKYSCISLAFLMVAVRQITACVTFWLMWAPTRYKAHRLCFVPHQNLLVCADIEM